MSKDVVVVGAGLGGLSAAIHCRLKGHRVLLLERHAQTGGKAAGLEIEGFKLDPGPSIVILTRIYEDLFRHAGRRMSDYLRFQRLDPFSRVYYRNRDELLDLPADREGCLQALRERFPEDAQSFGALMSKLDRVAPLIEKSIFRHPYRHPWQLLDPKLIGIGVHLSLRQTYRELVDRWFTSPLLRAFFYGFPSYGGQSYLSKAPGAFMIPYLMLQEGVYYPEGGVAAIPRALEKLARELGVEIRTRCEVSGLVRKGNRITHVDTEEGRFACDAVISNLDRATAGKWLGRNIDLQPSYSYFTVHWGLRRKLDGLKHHTLIVPEGFECGFEMLYRERKFPEPPIVYLNATSEIDPRTTPTGCTNLFAVVTSPAVEPHIDWEGSAATYRKQVVGQLNAFGFEIKDEDIVFERIQTPTFFESQHGNYRGSLYGVGEQHRLFGLFPWRNEDEEVANLFYCGGSVQPGAGLPMVTLSGRFAAERL